MPWRILLTPCCGTPSYHSGMMQALAGVTLVAKTTMGRPNNCSNLPCDNSKPSRGGSFRIPPVPAQSQLTAGLMFCSFCDYLLVYALYLLGVFAD